MEANNTGLPEPTKETINVEQVVQNYLIEPDMLFSNTEKATTTLGEVKFSEEDLKQSNVNNNFQNLSASGQYIPPFNNSASLKLTAPSVVLEKPIEPQNVSKKEFQNVLNQLTGTINPALQNLYSSVSAVMEKGKDPKGFTEIRPTYNGDAFFFADEVKRTSQKFLWS
jgi:hypothetical protein